jgi:hypothetical protein
LRLGSDIPPLDEFITHRRASSREASLTFNVFDMNVSMFQSTASAFRTMQFWFILNGDQALVVNFACSRDSDSVLSFCKLKAGSSNYEQRRHDGDELNDVRAEAQQEKQARCHRRNKIKSRSRLD